MSRILHPTEVAAFRAWSKAMIEGARVERPKHKKSGKGRKNRRKQRRKRIRRMRRSRE